MQYMGGKSRIAGAIANIINEIPRRKIQNSGPDCLRHIRDGGGLTYCIQGNCIDRADTAGCNGKGWTEGVAYTLNTVDRPAVVPFVIPVENHAQDCRVKLSEDGTVQPLSGKMGTGGGNVPLILGGALSPYGCEPDAKEAEKEP